MGQGKHLVFISHASEDKAAADAICATLEKAGVNCWIAPRDVGGGSWAKSILDAIVTTRVMVLVFSRHTQRSPHVLREIERAVHHRLAIAPLRLEDIMPAEELEFFLSSQHWIDLFPGPVEQHLGKVRTMVCGLVGVKAPLPRPGSTNAKSQPTAKPTAAKSGDTGARTRKYDPRQSQA